MKKTIFAAAVIAIIGITALGLSRQPVFATSVASGDLIRGTTYSAVYYMGADAMRYVFPNEKTYSTWYSNFDSVKFISDSELAAIQIGGNVTYKPGIRMVKIESDPKTYAVSEGGVLRHVGSESLATTLYGGAWNTMIDDVPDGFFTNYTIGDEIVTSADYSVTVEKANTSSINEDKSLVAPAGMGITDSAYSPNSITISVGQGVKFTNSGSTTHTVTADDLSWGTGTLQPGGSFIKKFTVAGTYTFFDSYNSQITGAVYVQ